MAVATLLARYLLLPLTFYPLTKILQSSTAVKAFETVEKVVYTDSDMLSPEE